MDDNLDAIVRAIGATRILEIGTGDGSATLQLASALPADGMLITIEGDPAAAAKARQSFATAGHGDRISVIAGLPSRFLHKVSGPFDLVFENCDSGAPRDRLLALLRSGGVLITADRQYSVKDMTIAEWLAAAKADAEKRGLPELVPLLDGLAQSTQRLRAGDWNDAADKDTPRDPDQ